ncbi:MAG: hypothetical protein HS116_25095 [Planctomycetes bacterium]|nr:hypothetical protein [Planctomycetota bacterium]
MLNGGAIQSGFRSALKTFLESYFDGAEHSFGGDEIEFPECGIVFDRPQAGANLDKPLIHIERIPDRASISKVSVAGQKRDTQIPAYVRVHTANKNWAVNDHIQDLLELALHGAAHQLAAAGVKVRRVNNSIPLALHPSQEIEVSQRIVIFRVFADFARADEPEVP